MSASVVTRGRRVRTRAVVEPLDLLDGRALDTWAELHATEPALDSPYFHPGFARAVQDAGVPVMVGRATAATGEVTSLFAFHRRRGTARPVGWPGADFQGVVASHGAAPDPRVFLADGVQAVVFDHLVDADGVVAPWVTGRLPSPLLDVTGGLDGYLSRVSRSGRENVGQARRRAARAERELGPLRFDPDSHDQDVLHRLIGLKREQYAATGARDHFADARRRRLLELLLTRRDGSFGGALATLHAGPHLLAAHMGIRSGGVLHWWFPVYDPSFAAYSPGWILLRELVRTAPQQGLTRIDLGRGDDEYKRRARTGSVEVAQAVVTASPLLAAGHRLGTRARAAVRSSPAAPTLRATLHVVRRMRGGPTS